MNKVEIDGYKRVQKRTAENLYREGQAIYLYPVNVRPGNPWIEPTKLHRDDNPPGTPCNTCNDRINAYAYYNCQYKALGYYPAYYIRPGEGA